MSDFFLAVFQLAGEFLASWGRPERQRRSRWLIVPWIVGFLMVAALAAALVTAVVALGMGFVRGLVM